MLNKIMLIGNLGRDPELVVTSEGTPITRFSLAVGRKWKDGAGKTQEETEWFNIVAWRRQAELCEQYLHKGSKVYIEGRLQQRKYEDKDGKNQIMVEVIVRDVQFLSGKQNGTSGTSGVDQEDPFLKDFPEMDA